MDKKSHKQQLYFKIKNNTASQQEVILFNQAAIFNSNSPGEETEYKWDIENELINSIPNAYTCVIILAAPVGTGIYTAHIFQNGGTIAFGAQVYIGLNTLGLGTFTIFGTFISIQSNAYIFSSLSIGNITTAQTVSGAGHQFTTGGSLILDPGYTQGLIGSFSQIPILNAFWSNNIAPNNDGPYNRQVIFTNLTPGSTQSMFANITSPAAKTIYFGIGWNALIGTTVQGMEIFLNNKKIISIPDAAALTALAASVNTQLGTSYTSQEVEYRCWFIFPVDVLAGQNIIQIAATSASGSFIFGFEAYNNTAAEIAAATSYAGLDLLYGSIEYVGQQFF